MFKKADKYCSIFSLSDTLSCFYFCSLLLFLVRCFDIRGLFMSLLKKLFVLLLLAGFYLPAHAAVDDVEIGFCSVFSEADEGKGEKGDGKGEEEEEPDCE